MRDKYNAVDAGRLAAMTHVAYTLSTEGSVTAGPVNPHIVPLESAFHRFDPFQTFQLAPQRPIILQPPYAWSTRRIILPAMDADAQRSAAMLAGLAGCKGPVSFECIIRNGRATFLLGAQPTEMDIITGSWLASYPQSAFTEPIDEDVAATLCVLYDVYSPEPYHRAIRAGHVAPWRQLFHFCQQLGNHLVWCQVIFAPAIHPWQSNMGLMQDAERSLGHRAPQGRTIAPKALDEPLFAAVVRIGATTPAIAPNIEAFLRAFTANGTSLRYRTIKDFEHVLSPEEIAAMMHQRTTHTSGQLLTASELSLFVHPPDRAPADIVHLDFLDGLPVPDGLRGDGIPLGVNTNRGVPVPVMQPLNQHNRSCWMIGRSRTGKSSAIVHRCRFLATQGYGVGLIDPHRTTAFDVLGTLDGIDRERIVFLDFDAHVPVAYNPFVHAHEEDYGRLTTEYVNSIKHLFGAEGYHRMNHLLGNGIFALFVLGANLAALPRLFSRTPEGEALRRRVIANVKNPEVLRFWQDEFPNYRPDAFAPIINRLSALLLDDRTLRTFTQEENRVDIAAWMDEAKVLIIAPPASIEAARIVGGFAIAQAKQAAFRRTGTSRANTHFHLIVDEWHRFITSATSVEQIINETGKAGLSVTLANQETGQIPADLLKAVFSIPNLFVFGVNLPEARALAHAFNGQVNAETLASQGTGSVHARIGTEIVNFHTATPLASNTAVAASIIADSQDRYHTLPNPAPPSTRQRRIIDTLE